MENIADRFDYENEEPKNLEVDIYEFALNFYKYANGISTDNDQIMIDITEYDISNNMPIQESEGGKKIWRGEDDEFINAKLE